MDMIKAIPTKYKNILFRSRLEARWGIVFDHLGLNWIYEYQGYLLDGEPYLPDFYMPDLHCYIEIKGEEPPQRSHDLAYALSRETCLPVHIFVGMVPRPFPDLWTDDHFDNYTYIYANPQGQVKGKLYQKDLYALNQCPKCRTVNFAPHGRLDRLPCGCDNPFTYKPARAIELAFAAGRIARF